jgi:indolepyruvate ferredoxin oxidoreductase
VKQRVEHLTAWQDAGYAARYERFVDRVRAAEARLGTGDQLARTVASAAAKLMSYKDEYEVARLYSNGEFEKRLADAFEGDVQLRFHLAPPLLAKKDADGHLVKKSYGPWVRHAFRWLAKAKGLRGTAFDVFGRTAERRMERALIGEYEQAIDRALARLTPETLPLIVELAALPEKMRGFGHVKEANVAKAKARWAAIEAQLAAGVAPAAVTPATQVKAQQAA